MSLRSMAMCSVDQHRVNGSIHHFKIYSFICISSCCLFFIQYNKQLHQHFASIIVCEQSHCYLNIFNVQFHPIQLPSIKYLVMQTWPQALNNVSYIACRKCVMNVDKVHRECYMARHRVLVTVICSKTFVVGALQKCVFYRSAGHYIWDFCLSFAACTFKHAQTS